MKKLIACLTLAAFAFTPVLQAGDGKTCDKTKASACCAEKAKACSSEKASCCTLGKRLSSADIKGASLLLAKK